GSPAATAPTRPRRSPRGMSCSTRVRSHARRSTSSRPRRSPEQSTRRETQMTTGRGSAWAGWIIFAGMMMMVIGLFNVFEGIVAVFADERVVATPDKLVVVDLTSWGWTLVLFGVVL